MATSEPAVPRLSARAFFDEVASELFSLDRGVPYTLWQLLLRPGPTIRRYVELRDARLTRPFRLVLICLAFAAAIMVLTDFGQGFRQGFELADAESEQPSGGAFKLALDAFIGHFDLILLACWVPAVAAGIQSMYRRHALNYAEAFVFGLYVLPLAILIALLLTVLLGAGLPIPIWFMVIGVFSPVAQAAHGYFRAEGEPLWRALMAALLAGFSLLVLMIALLIALTLLKYAGT